MVKERINELVENINLRYPLPSLRPLPRMVRSVADNDVIM